READLQVGDDVVDALQADGQTHLSRLGAGGQLLLVGELLVGGRPGVDDQRAYIADVGDVAVQGQRVDERPRRLLAAGDVEGEHRAGAARGQRLAALVPRRGRQPGVGVRLDLGVAGEELGDLLGV